MNSLPRRNGRALITCEFRLFALSTSDKTRANGSSLDLRFWYNSAFGSPLARGLGIGYVQELVSRLTHTPISVHNTSTNATINDNPILFPLGQSLYVDATHEVVFLNGEYS